VALPDFSAKAVLSTALFAPQALRCLWGPEFVESLHSNDSPFNGEQAGPFSGVPAQRAMNAPQIIRGMRSA